MENLVLVLNAGSSSLKFSLYQMPEEIEIVNGNIEKIGSTDSIFSIKTKEVKIEENIPIQTHFEAVQKMLYVLSKNHFINSLNDIKAVGHRIVHGGDKYRDSVLIDEVVMMNIESLKKLVPLHVPAELTIINSIEKILDVPQVAVFDTSFHQTIPEENFMYALPYEFYKNNGVRKYGFHGTSHKYITEEMKKRLNKEDVNLIICHLGNGSSVTAIKDGKSFNTSMGLTPLDGIVMGTRSGSIDPSIISYIASEKDMNIKEILHELNNNSGLKGICGKSDIRDVLSLVDNGDKKAILAIKMLEKSIIKYISNYYFELEGKIDGLVFTAGIGENAMTIREDIINSIGPIMGMKIDNKKNNSIAKYLDTKEGVITTENSNINAYVIPTNEEVMILRDTYRLAFNYEYKNNKRVS